MSKITNETKKTATDRVAPYENFDHVMKDVFDDGCDIKDYEITPEGRKYLCRIANGEIMVLPEGQRLIYKEFLGKDALEAEETNFISLAPVRSILEKIGVTVAHDEQANQTIKSMVQLVDTAEHVIKVQDQVHRNDEKIIEMQKDTIWLHKEELKILRSPWNTDPTRREAMQHLSLLLTEQWDKVPGDASDEFGFSESAEGEGFVFTAIRSDIR